MYNALSLAASVFGCRGDSLSENGISTATLMEIYSDRAISVENLPDDAASSEADLIRANQDSAVNEFLDGYRGTVTLDEVLSGDKNATLLVTYGIETSYNGDGSDVESMARFANFELIPYNQVRELTGGAYNLSAYDPYTDPKVSHITGDFTKYATGKMPLFVSARAMYYDLEKDNVTTLYLETMGNIAITAIGHYVSDEDPYSTGVSVNNTSYWLHDGSADLTTVEQLFSRLSSDTLELLNLGRDAAVPYDDNHCYIAEDSDNMLCHGIYVFGGNDGKED